MKENQMFLNVQEGADILRIDRLTLYRKIAAGEIPSVRIGRRILVPREWFNKIVQESLQPVTVQIGKD